MLKSIKVSADKHSIAWESLPFSRRELVIKTSHLVWGFIEYHDARNKAISALTIRFSSLLLSTRKYQMSIVIFMNKCPDLSQGNVKYNSPARAYKYLYINFYSYLSGLNVKTPEEMYLGILILLSHFKLDTKRFTASMYGQQGIFHFYVQESYLLNIHHLLW